MQELKAAAVILAVLTLVSCTPSAGQTHNAEDPYSLGRSVWGAASSYQSDCYNSIPPSAAYGIGNATYHERQWELAAAAQNSAIDESRNEQLYIEAATNPRGLRWGMILEQYTNEQLRCWVDRGDQLATFALAMALKFDQGDEARAERLRLLRIAGNVETPVVVPPPEVREDAYLSRQLFPVGCNGRIAEGEVTCDTGLPEALLELAKESCDDLMTATVLYRRAIDSGLWSAGSDFGWYCNVLTLPRRAQD